ncbi:MAG: DUF2878 domain-containing protein [Pseudomonadota bacterium]
MARDTLINAVLFQVLWFASVIVGGVHGLLWPCVVASVVLLASVWPTPERMRDVLLASVLVPIGWALDTVWAVFGVLDFDGAPLAPLWIATLWFGVALSVNHSLKIFRDNALIGSLVVGAFAPFSYFGGSKLGAVSIPALAPLGAIAIAWFVLFYLVFRFSADRAGDESPVAPTVATD